MCHVLVKELLGRWVWRLGPNNRRWQTKGQARQWANCRGRGRELPCRASSAGGPVAFQVLWVCTVLSLHDDARPSHVLP